MPRPGDEVLSPPTGERLVFRQTAESSGGELFQAEIWMEPSSHVIGCHIHPEQEERFVVLGGTLATRIGGEERVLKAGGEVIVPLAARHEYWNAGDDELHILYEHRPARPSAELFFETYYGLSRDGKLDEKGYVKNPLQGAVLAWRVRDFLRPCSPPFALQPLLFSVGSVIGRLLGYRSSYERYRARPAAPPSSA
jgi:mannose-6-phosphate isomerase-like protein (cupin superfamily)